jgi:hypothetical protein
MLPQSTQLMNALSCTDPGTDDRREILSYFSPTALAVTPEILWVCCQDNSSLVMTTTGNLAVFEDYNRAFMYVASLAPQALLDLLNATPMEPGEEDTFDALRSALEALI